MGATINYNFPIYDDDWPPDLTSTGAEAQAIIDIDTELKKQETQESEDASRLNQLIQDERTERTDADTTLQTTINKETEERKAADSELKSSVENVENELTGVSADVTGVFGLTYGDDNVNFIEKAGDAYSSPALIEIQHQITDASAAPAWGTVTDKPFETVGTGLSVTDNALEVYLNNVVTSISPLQSAKVAATVDTTAFAAGSSAKALYDKSIAIGSGASAKKSGSIALGSNASCDADNSISVGRLASSNANGTALGYKAAAYSSDSTALGFNAVAQGNNSSAVGSVSNASAAQSLALGASTSCAKKNSVAIGYKSSAARENEVSIGSGTAGEDDEVTRLIAHVSDPETYTDCVNARTLSNAIDSALDTIAEFVLPNFLKSTVWSDIES